MEIQVILATKIPVNAVNLHSLQFRKGTVFHESMGKHFSQGYCEGDTLGILIELPDIPSGNYIPPTYKDKVS